MLIGLYALHDLRRLYLIRKLRQALPGLHQLIPAPALARRLLPLVS